MQDRIGDEARIHQHDVVTVRRRMRDVIGADDAARARLVFRHHRLPHGDRELLGQHASGEIDDTARRIRQDEVNGQVRVVLR